MRTFHIFLVLGFVILYSAFTFFINIPIELEVASELTVAGVFFFALFSGFFITRQNERYSKVVDIISERDGLYSYLYRVFGMVPRIQNDIREIIRKHYTKILNSNNWAYNEFNPSTTITNLTKSMSSLTKEETERIDGHSPFDGIWDSICQLQQNRKKIIAEYNARLVLFQWILVYVFAFLIIFSFGFLQTESFLVNILKIILGKVVFLVIVLLKQLNDLSIFGKNFSKHIAHDLIRILDEADIKEYSENE